MMTQNEDTALSPWQPLNGQRVRRISRWHRRAHEVSDGKMVNVCTVNVGTLRGRSRELVEMLSRRKVSICCIQEVRYRNQGATTIGTGDEKYKLWYSGNDTASNGVGILVSQDIVENVVEIERYGDRIMKAKLVLGNTIYHVLSVYAPQVGRTDAEKEDFWEKLEDLICVIPERDNIIVAGDLNGHIGQSRSGYEDVMGAYGFGDINVEGRTILNFCKNQNLRIANTFFQKPREKLITFKSGETETQIDFVLYRPRRGFQARDCAAFPGEACLTQHRPIRAKFFIADYVARKWKGVKKPKVWKLKNDETRAEFEAKFTEKLQQQEVGWGAVQESIYEACREVCGMTTGRRGAEEREIW